ncbi:TPA: phage portal protein [Enterobacter hormaechei subsp. xiangfangensis]
MKTSIINGSEVSRLSVAIQTRYQVEFDSADLLRATPTERYATYERGIKNGIMNPNEAREREGMPPREGGDEFSQAWKQEVKISKDSKDGDL